MSTGPSHRPDESKSDSPTTAQDRVLRDYIQREIPTVTHEEFLSDPTEFIRNANRLGRQVAVVDQRGETLFVLGTNGQHTLPAVSEEMRELLGPEARPRETRPRTDNAWTD